MEPIASVRPLLLALLALGGVAAKLPLPAYVRPCSLRLSDRKLSECAVKSAREAFPHVLKGDPDYNVPKMDPLHLDRLVVIDGKGPLGMQLIATDVELYGLPDVILNSTNFQMKQRLVTYVATIPDVRVLAKYNVTGRILLLPIVGKGNVVMTLKNVQLVYQYNWTLAKFEDGEIYFVPKPGAKLNVDVDGMTVTLDNIFNGDKALLDSTNKFLNDEWREVFDSLQPSFTTAIAEVIDRILKGIFYRVPQKDAWQDVQEEDLQITDDAGELT